LFQGSLTDFSKSNQFEIPLAEQPQASGTMMVPTPSRAGAMLGGLALVAVALLAITGWTTRDTALEEVYRNSIFDQWMEPRGAEEQNPTVRRYGREAAGVQLSACEARCAPHDGYNPTDETIESCTRFCNRLFEDTIPRKVTVPAGHGWWVRKLPGGKEVRYLGAGELAGVSRTWVDDGDSTQAPSESEDPRHDYGRAMQKDTAPGEMLLQVGEGSTTIGGENVASMLARAQADLARLRANPKASIRGRAQHGGSAPVQFSHKQAESSMDSYFDSLPTKDCSKPDCNYENRQVVKTRTLVRKGEKFTTKDIDAYERRVLGYHRRHEEALAASELSNIGSESAKIIDGSVSGFNRLEAGKALHRAAEPNTHSHAYARAESKQHFAGYYYNVFGGAAPAAPAAAPRADAVRFAARTPAPAAGPAGAAPLAAPGKTAVQMAQLEKANRRLRTANLVLEATLLGRETAH